MKHNKPKTWFVATILNIKTGKCEVFSSENHERIDALKEILQKDEILFKNDNVSSGQ